MTAGLSHSKRSRGGLRHSHAVCQDVFRVAQPIVNMYLIGAPGSPPGHWFLVDAGLPLGTRQILRAVEELYGKGSRPGAFLMTHGHFDHVGALEELARLWNVPVYCHRREAPYLDGSTSYLPPDPRAGGGAMAWMSPLYPRGPVDVTDFLHILPGHGTIPGLPDWEWIPTPGHTPGHVSFFRRSDGLLIAGDAFVTTRQESMLWALLHPKEVNGPPKYFTPDWEAARQSVHRLNRFPIRVACTGHGKPMAGRELREGLRYLINHFAEKAVPAHGRYVHDHERHHELQEESARCDGRDSADEPEAVVRPAGPAAVLAVALGVAGVLGLMHNVKRQQPHGR